MLQTKLLLKTKLILFGILFSLISLPGYGQWDPDPVVGINHNAGNLDPAKADERIGWSHDLGMKRVRMGMDGVCGYRDGEGFCFDARNVIVDKYIANNIYIMSVISPTFHVDRPTDGSGIPNNQSAWEANWRYFCNRVMNQYKGRIFHYIIDNEPDNESKNARSRMDANTCITVTRIAYEEAAKVDSRIQIESPPPVGPRSPLLREMIEGGITNYCHFVGYHTYGGQIYDGQMEEIWHLFNNNPGVPRRPVSASEIGTFGSWGSSCGDGEQVRRRWFENYNYKFKRWGFATTLLFDIDGEAEAGWQVVGTPSYDAIKYGYRDKPLTNGSFDSGNNNLSDMNEWMANYPDCNYSSVPGDFLLVDGGVTGRCLEVRNENSITQIAGKIAPGSTVTVTVKAWVDGGTARLRLLGYDRLNGFSEGVQSTSTGGSWITLSSTVTPSNPWVVVELSHLGGGTAWFDDVVVNGGASAPIGQTIYLRAVANGNYVCADNAGASPLIANRTTVGGWEKFTVHDAGNGRIALRAVANGKYVLADNAGNNPLIAKYDGIGFWEQFEWVDAGGGRIGLKAVVNGKFVCADNGGSSALIANRNAIGGDWEKFEWGITSARMANMADRSGEGASELSLEVFPNPYRNGALRVTLKGFTGKAPLLMTDLRGRVIYQNDLEAGTHTLRTPAKLTHGLYLLRVQKGNQATSRKLLIE